MNKDLTLDFKKLKDVEREAYNYLTAEKNTETTEFSVEKHMGEDERVIEKMQSLCASTEGNLSLIAALPGVGKTTAILNLMESKGSDDGYTILINPKISNLEQITASRKYITLYTAETKKNISILGAGGPYKENQFIATVPELALEVFAKCKDVRTIIIDEAHDVLCNIGTYRDLAPIYKMLARAKEHKTNIICMTATPAPIDWINFDNIINIKTLHPINSGNFLTLSVDNQDSKHTSYSACFSTKLIDLFTSYGPVFALYDDIKGCKKISESLTNRGYKVITIDKDSTPENNTAYHEIIHNSMLPTTYDFVLTTSTLISGISIKQNPDLGNRQFIPVVIIDSSNKLEISTVQQFVTRLRYDVPATVLMKKKCVNKLTYQPLHKIMSEITALVNIAHGSFGGKFSNGSAPVVVNPGCNYLEYKAQDVSILFNDDFSINDFSVKYNARHNYDLRLYTDSNFKHLCEELSKVLSFTSHSTENCIFTADMNRTTGLTREQRKELSSTSAKQRARETAKEALGHLESILNNNTTDAAAKAFMDANRTQVNDIRLYSSFAGKDGGNSILKAIAAGTNQKEISALKYDIYKKSFEETVEVTKMVNGIAVKEHMPKGQVAYLLDIGSGNFRMNRDDRAVCRNLQKSELYDKFVSIVKYSNLDFDVALHAIDDCRNKYTVDQLIRKSAAQAIFAQCYDGSVMNGEDVKILLNSSLLAQEVFYVAFKLGIANGKSIFGAGQELSRSTLSEIAAYLNIVVTKRHRRTYTVDIVKVMMVDLFGCSISTSEDTVIFPADNVCLAA